MNSNSRFVLYVDNDEDSCQLMKLLIQQYNKNIEITCIESVEKALNLISDRSFNLFVLDHRLPDLTGVELCRLIRETDSETPIIIYSAMAREIDRQEALKAGATAYLIKSYDLDKFSETVEQLLNN